MSKKKEKAKKKVVGKGKPAPKAAAKKPARKAPAAKPQAPEVATGAGVGVHADASAPTPAKPETPPLVTEAEINELKEKTKAAEKDRAAELKRLDKLGLMEIPVRGTTLTLVGLKEPNKAPPTVEQRAEMAKRLIDVSGRLPRYVMHLVDEKKPGTSVRAIVDVANAEAVRDEIVKKKVKEKKVAAVKEAKGGKKKPAAAAAAPAKPAAGKAKAKGRGITKPSAVPSGGFTAANKPATSGELIRARIMDPKNKMTDEQIAAEVRKLWPGRTTGVTDVRWNRAQMLKVGIAAPDPVGEDTKKK